MKQRRFLINPALMLTPRFSRFRQNASSLLVTATLTLILYYVYRHTTAFPTAGLHIRGTCARSADLNRGQWYNFTDNSRRLYIYSAHYDDRPSLFSQPVVRLMAIADPIPKFKHALDNIYCILQYRGRYRALRMTEIPRPIGYGWPLNGQPAREYVLTCPTVEGVAPDTVSISSNLSNDAWLCVPVNAPHKPIERREFGVCVQAVYGTVDPYRLIEWMEVQKLLGVNFVGIYVLSANELAMKVLDYYSKTGFVDLQRINYIYSSSNDTVREFWLHLTPSINDCIYRHMYELDRIIVIDFDEILMPRIHKHLSGLVAYLDEMYASRNSPRVNYVFRNNYFFLNLPPDDEISPHLTVLRYRKKIRVSRDGYSVKSMIQPQACIHMHNHYCWGVTANYSRYESTDSVDPAIALIQHYKKCHFPAEDCRKILHNWRSDETMMFLKQPLMRNVREMVRKILNEDV